MFQLYLPEMHMDAKLQVILKGILVTEEDGVKFSGLVFFLFSQKSFAHYLHVIKRSLAIQAIYNNDAKGMRWRWVNMQIFLTCDLSYCMVMFLNDFYDDKTKFGVNTGFEDLIGIHCH